MWWANSGNGGGGGGICGGGDGDGGVSDVAGCMWTLVRRQALVCYDETSTSAGWADVGAAVGIGGRGKGGVDSIAGLDSDASKHAVASGKKSQNVVELCPTCRKDLVVHKAECKVFKTRLFGSSNVLHITLNTSC